MKISIPESYLATKQMLIIRVLEKYTYIILYIYINLSYLFMVIGLS